MNLSSSSVMFGEFGFVWPWALALLALLPLLTMWYLRGLRGRGGSAATHSDGSRLARLGVTPRHARHLPAALYLAAVALAVVALARPTARMPAPDDLRTIVLSVDVSCSMRAPDVAPNRIVAAQEAARTFVKAVPDSARVGLVTFDRSATLRVSPTTRHETLLSAIDEFTLTCGTAIGDGLLESLRALPGREDGREARPPFPAAAVVLLSDGRNNVGADPLTAAARARELDVPVFTVGLGTDGGFVSGGRQGDGMGFNAGFDEQTLREMATLTGGRYYEASSAGELREIYGTLARSLGWTSRIRELTVGVALLAALALVASLAAAERITRRVL